MTSEHFESREITFYVGSYASLDEPGISLCGLNLNTGEMRVIHHEKGIDHPSFLIYQEEKSRLYAVSEKKAGMVLSYAVTPVDGRLRKLSEVRTHGEDPCHLAFSPVDQGLVLAANYSSAHVNSYKLDDNGATSEMIALVRHVGSGFRPDRQEAAHAHSIVPSRNGKFAYVSDLGLDQIVIYRLEHGELVNHGNVKLPPGTGPRHFVIHPSERCAYGINELNNTLTVYSFDPVQGYLEIIQHVNCLPDGFVGENCPADIHLSPDGRYVYGSNRGHDSIVRFAVNPVSGQLGDPEWTGTGGSWPRNFTVLEQYILAANQYSDNIVAFERDTATGKLSATGQKLVINKPSCIEPAKLRNDGLS